MHVFVASLSSRLWLQMNYFLQVTFDDGEAYSWQKVGLRLSSLLLARYWAQAAAMSKGVSVKVRVAISNLVMGQPVVDHFGVYTVDSTSGLTAVVELCKPKLLTFSAQSRKDSQHMVRPHLQIS